MNKRNLIISLDNSFDIESSFLIYPTYGISGVSGGVNYDDRNVLGYDCSGLSMALIYLIGGYNFDRENTNAQKMYNIAKESCFYDI